MNKIIIVTGASRGIGKEIAKDLDMDISDINTKLTMMELEGLIIQTKLGMFKKV